MKEAELLDEVRKDFINAFNYSDTKEKKLRRLAIKANRFPVYAHSFYTSPRKNKWIIFFEARSKKEVGDNCRICCTTYFNTKHGTYAVLVTFTEGKQHLILYPPHFFSRFASRCGIELHGVDLIVRFFQYNYNYVFTFKDVPLGENTYRREVYGTAKEGVALGFLTDNANVLFKTFITYDMLKGEQIDTFTANEQLRQEIHES
jgi:hypothetical protein